MVYVLSFILQLCCLEDYYGFLKNHDNEITEVKQTSEYGKVLTLEASKEKVYVAKTARDNLGSYIAIGIAGIFFFHMTENIGMTMGLLPITGVPLPFVSYGGSSLLTNLILIGLLLNISGRRKKSFFVGQK